jgi:hypothetical protein
MAIKFLNTATAATQAVGDNSTKIATTAYADAAASAIPIGNYLPLSAGASKPLTGGLHIPHYIYHAGNTGTVIGYPSVNRFVIGTNSVTRVDVTDAGLSLGDYQTNVSVSTILDEDDMASDSATALVTQQSVKAYVDAHPGSGGTVTGTGASAKVAVWTNTTNIIDGPITFTSNDATFAGDVTAPSFIGKLMGGATGAPDATIWCVSGDYTDWGIFYDENTPDVIQFKSGGTTTASISLDNGDYTGRNATFAGNISGGKVLVNQSSDLTTQVLQVNGFIDITDVTSTALRWYNGSTFRGGLGLDDWAHSGSSSDITMYIAGDNSFHVSTNNVKRLEIDSSGATFNGNTITTGTLSIGQTTTATVPLEVNGGAMLTNQRVDNAEKYPIGHYQPGETLFEIDTTWTDTQLRKYFNNSNVSWNADADAPGGYAIYINGAVSVGGEYGSGFPYIPVDDDGIYYMECYIKNVGTSQRHYMGSNEYNESFGSTGGNPGSFGYWVMSNTNPGSSWTKVSGYITDRDASATGKFELGTKYWTPLALFNYGAGSGTRACLISGWKVIRVDSPGNRYFDSKVYINAGASIPNRTEEFQVTGTQIITNTGTNSPSLFLGYNSSGSTTVQLGRGRTADGLSYIDLNGEVMAAGDYGFRIMRRSGVNAITDLIQVGTGNLTINALNGADTVFTNTNVGIGTTNPKSKLHVLDGAAGTYTPSSESDTLVVESATPGGISLIGTGAGGNAKQSVVFGTSSDPTMANIVYDGNNSFLSIGTTTTSNYVRFTSGNSVEAMRIAASGKVMIGTTTATSNANLTVKESLAIQSGSSTVLSIFTGYGSSFINTGTSGGTVRFGAPTSYTTNVYVQGTLEAASSVQMGNNTAAASAANAGSTRYRVSGNNSYMDMSMRTGSTTYAWVNIVQNNW